MRKKFYILVGICIAAIGGGVFLLNHRLPGMQHQSANAGLVTPQQDGPDSPISGWKVYQNDQMELSLNYPSGAKIYGPNPEPDDWRVDVELGRLGQSADLTIVRPKSPAVFSIHRVTTVTAEEAGWRDWSETTTTIDGRQFLDDTYSHYVAGLHDNTRTVDLIELSGNLEILLTLDPYSASLTDERYLNLFSRVISTLTFAE